MTSGSGTSSGAVTYELVGEIALVGLNRPQKRNAIGDFMVEEIGKAVERARNEARAGVIYGHGKHFCAGLDLGEHVEKSPMAGIEGSHRWHDVFSRIEFGPIPWFAALHGAVVGGGLELASSTHVRVADEGAFFALPEGQRGIFVGGGGSVRCQRLLGTARMTDMMLTGRSIAAVEAERWNLVQYVVPEGAAVEKALELAKAAASNSPVSNYAVVNALPRISGMSSADGLFMESFIASFTSASDEAKGRLNAFLEKRAAKVRRPGEK